MARGVTFLVNPSYSPFSYEENGSLKGLAVELVKLLSSEFGLEAEMVAMPFEEAYTKLQDGGEYALPTLVFTPQRKSQFNWVGPIAVTPTYLYARDDSRDIRSIDDARKAGKVGAVRGYYSQQLLAEQGLDTVIFDDETTLLKSLLEGGIDLAPFNYDVYKYLTENIPESSKLHATIVLDLDMTYIGFSKDVPLDTLRMWQEALDSLKSSGDFAGLYEKWLPGRPVPGIYTLLTEEYPPVTYMGDGEPEVSKATLRVDRTGWQEHGLPLRAGRFVSSSRRSRRSQEGRNDRHYKGLVDRTAPYRSGLHESEEFSGSSGHRAAADERRSRSRDIHRSHRHRIGAERRLPDGESRPSTRNPDELFLHGGLQSHRPGDGFESAKDA
jgi:polar amino acid transport system substrate-binding protein